MLECLPEMEDPLSIHLKRNWATHDPEETNNYNGLGWPVQYAKDFADAQTPLDKAKVAVKLLQEIVKKGGIVLYYNKLEAK